MGCGQLRPREVRVKTNKIINVRPDPDSPDQGLLLPQGHYQVTRTKWRSSRLSDEKRVGTFRISAELGFSEVVIRARKYSTSTFESCDTDGQAAQLRRNSHLPNRSPTNQSYSKKDC